MLSPKCSLSPKRKASTLTPVGLCSEKSPNEVNHMFPVDKNMMKTSPIYNNITDRNLNVVLNQFFR